MNDVREGLGGGVRREGVSVCWSSRFRGRLYPLRGGSTDRYQETERTC